MRVLVAGADGYLGWPMTMRLSAAGHEVLAVDSLVKRRWERDFDAAPLMPVLDLPDRATLWRQVSGRAVAVEVGDLCDEGFLNELVFGYRPDALIDFAQQPSAPMSMLDEQHGITTQVNNLVGTLRILYALRRRAPSCHLIKFGTMGEYGTPNIDIEEGFLDVDHNGRRDLLPFPKQPGSIYHLSKVHDSNNIAFACRAWELRASDLNQGVVYGVHTAETRLHPDLRTSFHYDAVFGTVLNRFCVQALAGMPLTVHGEGGQTRGFLNIVDTLQSVQAVLGNLPIPGEYRVFNQFAEQFTVNELAERVVAAARRLGHDAVVAHVPNPRVEKEQHHYRARHDKLAALGVRSHLLDEDVLVDLLRAVEPFVATADTACMAPDHNWREHHRDAVGAGEDVG